MKAPTRMARRRSRRLEYRFIEPMGSGFRGYWMERGKLTKGPVFPTQKEAHEDALGHRQRRARHGRIVTLADAVDLVRRDLERRNRRDGTRRWFDGQVAILFRAWPGGEIPLAKLDRDEIQWFIDRRMGLVSASTVNHHLRALNRIFVLAMREGAVGENPVRMVTKPEGRSRQPDHFRKEELDSIDGRLRGWDCKQRERDPAVDADWLRFFFAVGARLSEIAGISIEDVDLRTRTLHLREGKKRPRDLPIVEPLAELLRRIIDRSDGTWLVPGGTAKKRVEFLKRVFTKWKKRLEDRRLHPHALRHSAASHLARCGHDPHILAAVLGHEIHHQNITFRYVTSHGPQLRRAMSDLWHLPAEVSSDVNH